MVFFPAIFFFLPSFCPFLIHLAIQSSWFIFLLILFSYHSVILNYTPYSQMADTREKTGA